MITLSQITATTGAVGVGGQQLLAEGGEGRADGLAGDLVEEPAAGKVDGAEDGPPSVLARGHDLVARPGGDPGGADPGQQVDVGLVFCQHGRAGGQLGELVEQVGQNLVAVGTALATSRGRRQPATSRTRRRRVQRLMAGRPSRWYSRGSSTPWAGKAAGGCGRGAGGCPGVAGPVGAGQQARPRRAG